MSSGYSYLGSSPFNSKVFDPDFQSKLNLDDRFGSFSGKVEEAEYKYNPGRTPAFGGSNLEKFGSLAGTFASLFDKARGRRGRYEDDMYGFRGGQIGGGGGGQILENLGFIQPQQAGAAFIPGSQASGGGFGDVASGALQGVAAGSKFGPWGALAGAGLGAAGGYFG